MDVQLMPLLAAVLGFSLGNALTYMALKERVTTAAENVRSNVLIALATRRVNGESRQQTKISSTK
jgi:hypothetical protein